MRVAFIAHQSSLSGANRSLVDLLRGLRNYDVQACVITPEGGELTEIMSSLHVPTYETSIPWSVPPKNTVGYALIRLGLQAKAMPRLASLIRAWEPDVVYSNTSVIRVGLLASKWLDLPHVWHLREFIDLDWGWKPDWGWDVFRLLTSQSDAIITVSDAVRRHLLRGREAARAHVIHSGVATRNEFERLRKEAHTRTPNGAPYTFALVGGLAPTKGQDIAIKAFAHVARQVPDVRLLIAGSGSVAYMEECRGLAHRLGVADAVRFLGHRNDPFRVFLDADAALMCSRYEAQGRVTIEAMAACRPVIGHNRGGTPEIVEHGRTGLLYEDGPENLATCMLRFAENPEWARQLGERGWRAAVERFSIEACARQTYGVLQKVAFR